MSQQQQQDEYGQVNVFTTPTSTNNVCPAGIPKPTVGTSPNNATRIRQYIVGANTRFKPILEYLNEMVGRTFDPPIEFIRKHPNLYLKAKTVGEALDMKYDFMVTNPYQSSCYETESYAVPLATQIFRDTDPTTYDNRYYNLTQYGATLYVLANRTDIRTIQDVKGKIVGSNKITGLATHLCYDVLLRNGVHHLQDPKQTIFFKHSDHALEAILSGRIDVGCASSSTLETYRDAQTGQPLDLSKIRILNPQNYTITTSDDGRSTTIPFPYAISSHLVPAFPVTASPRVEQIVKLRVQKALIDMRDHADVAPSILACIEAAKALPTLVGTVGDGCQSVNNTHDCLLEACFQFLLLEQASSSSSNGTSAARIRNCDTTPELALKAFHALNASGLPGFTSPQQNYHLRDIQETTGFLVKDDTTSSSDQQTTTDGTPRCVRFQNIENAVTCPEGYFVRSSEEIVQQCNASALPCYDVPCLCNPCVKAFEVDFFVTASSSFAMDSNSHSHDFDTKMMGSGCPKFSICGSVQQGHPITFRTIDNKERPNAKMTGAILRGDESIEPFAFVKDFTRGSGSGSNETASFASNYSYHYDFLATQRRVGQMIVKIWINDEQIPESPFRINVVKRDCLAHTGDPRREADELGQCICQRGSVELSNKCVPWWTILVPCCVGLFLLLGLCFYQYHLNQKKQREKEESLWMVQKDEILFDTPPTILGRGAFGLVLLGEFRGTKVAVKRVIVPQGLQNRSGVASSNDVERGTTPSSGAANVQIPASPGGEESPLPPAAAEAAKSELEKKAGLEEDYSPTGVGVRLSSNPGEFRAPARDGAAELAARLSTAGFMHRSRGGSELFAKLMKLREDFIEEIRVLNRLRHPNVTTLMGAVLDDIDGPLIIMEYMDLGSLYDLLRNESKVLGEEQLLSILSGVSQGMRFLHACDPPFLHGDLKARNILLDSRYHAKVADFGLSHSQKECKKPVGTPYWTAPELLRGESLNTTSSDMYSFGVLLYEAFSRKEPYEGEDTMTVLVQVANPIVNKRPPIPTACSPQIRSLMAECFVNTPEYRPTFEEVDQRLKRVDLKTSTKPGCDKKSEALKQDDGCVGHA